MAGVKQHSKIISLKLESLEQHRIHLQGVVNTYVDKVVNVGKAWLDDTDKSQRSIHEVSQLIENAITLLTQKAVEMSDGDTASASLETSSFSPAMRADADSVSQGQAIQRLAAVEKAIVSLVAAGGKISDLENTLGELKAKQFEIDVRVEGVSEKQCEMDEKLEEMTAKQFETGESVKKIFARQREINDKVFEVSAKLQRASEETEKTSAKLSQMDKQVKELSVEHHQVVREIGDMSQLSTLSQEASASTSDTTMVQAILSSNKKNSKEMRELRDQIKGVKKETREDLKKVGKKYEKVEQKYKTVCHIVADRLLPLEKLRDIFNKKVKNRDEDVQKQNRIEQQVSDLSTEMTKLAGAASQMVGFTAYFPEVNVVKKDSIVTSFRDVFVDVGGHFDSQNGTFTAPVDGLYSASITLWQCEDGTVDACVIHKSSGYDLGKKVCLAATDCKSTSGTAVGIVAMKTGDILCVRIEKMLGCAQLSHGTSFSCFLVR